ncbi:MAG TPA: hypothetical protein VN176_02650 [Verrucomicrobiae bacterium]|jgi:hypothetical protein|nr:hypothetical protein [Verrucomicrobiae bacterium]
MPDELNPVTAASVDHAAFRRASFPFQLLLPFGQLMVCAVLLWPSRGYIAWQFGLHPPRVLRILGGLTPLTLSTSTAIRVINLPAVFIQLPYAIFSPEHTDWHPPGIDTQAWESVTVPLIGMVFWWLPGRALEALAAARHRILKPRIGWVETVVGFLLMAGGLTLLIGGLVFSPPTDRRDLMWPALSGGMWALLGGVGFAARIVQWRLRRKSAQSTGP